MTSTAIAVGPKRLALLRLAYALVAIGTALTQWPSLGEIGPQGSGAGDVVHCMLVAIGLLAFAGLARPLAMLPVLYVEIAWKVVWVALVGLPGLLGGTLNEATTETLFACAFILPVIAAIPWKSVVVRPAARGQLPRTA